MTIDKNPPNYLSYSRYHEQQSNKLDNLIGFWRCYIISYYIMEECLSVQIPLGFYLSPEQLEQADSGLVQQTCNVRLD